MRILYVDDNPTDADLTRRACARLAPDLEIADAGTLKEARRRLASDPPYDLVLSDLRLPDGNGLQLLSELRAKAWPGAVVIVTGKGDEANAVAALKGGADNYLVKDNTYLERLPAILRQAHRHFQAAQSAQAAQITQAPRLRILYLERDATDAELIERHLATHAPQIQVTVFTSPDLAKAALEQLRNPAAEAEVAPYDLLLLDYNLSPWSGLDILRTLREDWRTDFPIVLITGHGNEEGAVKALHLGANDYLLKTPEHLLRLPTVLESAFQHVALARERARYQALIERIPAAVYIASSRDPALLRYVSPQIEPLLGYPPAGWLMAPGARLARVHPDDRALVRGMFARALAGEGSLTTEYHMLRLDGSTIWVRDELHCVLQKDGTLEHFQGFLQDITVAKEAEQRLRQAYAEVESRVTERTLELVYVNRNLEAEIGERRRAEEQLRLAATAIAWSGEAMLITDKNATILSVNPAFTRITGYDAEEVVGKNPKILSSDRHDPAFYQAMWRTLLDQGRWEGEIWDRRKSGEVYPKWLGISAIRAPTGETTHYLGIFSDISERKVAESRIEFLAHHDPLTELPNRLLLQDRFHQAAARARREGTRFALFFLDLDRFKNINDSLGHAVGDELLRQVARILRDVTRNTDTVCRHGGDEFLLLLEDIDHPEDVTDILQKIALALTSEIACGSHCLRPTVSIGVAMFPEDGEDFDTLVRNADLAMYAAKEAGRNNFRFYSERLNVDTRRRLDLVTRLRQALAEDQFLLYYQPQVEIATGRIVGVEALVRWADPRDGLVAPDQFIPLAEENGLIVAINRWVLRQACLQARAWRRQGLPRIGMAVNTSAPQFTEDEIVDELAAAMKEHGLEAGELEIELTESIFMHDVAGGMQRLHRIRDLGIGIALDDFGTGYSSLAYLKRFALHKLKIALPFVQEVTTDPDSAAIVRAIAQMAQTLKLITVAEGVETAEQVNFLREIGCELAQGYYYSRPLPAAEMEALLRQDAVLPVATGASVPLAPGTGAGSRKGLDRLDDLDN